MMVASGVALNLTPSGGHRLYTSHSRRNARGEASLSLRSLRLSLRQRMLQLAIHERNLARPQLYFALPCCVLGHDFLSKEVGSLRAVISTSLLHDPQHPSTSLLRCRSAWSRKGFALLPVRRQDRIDVPPAKCLPHDLRGTCRKSSQKGLSQVGTQGTGQGQVHVVEKVFWHIKLFNKERRGFSLSQTGECRPAWIIA